MLTRHPERPARLIGPKYFYVLGLLSGIGLTFSGLAILADLKSDYFDAHVFMAIIGSLLVIIGLLPLMIFHTLWRRLPIERRESEGWLTILKTPWILLSLSLSSLGMALFSLKVLQLLLGPSSFVPDIINGLFLVGGAILLLMGVKRLVPLYERMQQGQPASDQDAASGQ